MLAQEDGLLVGDDRQGLQRGLGELGVDFALVEFLKVGAEFREREQLVAAGDLFDSEAAVGLFVFGVELFDGGADGTRSREVHQFGQAAGG